MTTATPRKQKRLRVIGWTLILLLLCIPAIVYVFTFGSSITANHTRWSEFGSAMSGLYSPLLAFLAFVVLIFQVRSQNITAKYQLEHAYIDQARADIEFYLEHLDRELSRELQLGITVRDLLHRVFIPAPGQSLQDEALSAAAKDFNLHHPRAFDLWSAIYPCLAGLAAPGKFPFEHHSLGARQKVIVMASFRTCVALDNLHYVVAQDRMGIKYSFTPNVPIEHREA